MWQSLPLAASGLLSGGSGGFTGERGGCVVDDKDKQALVGKLSSGKNAFHVKYSGVNRKWFAGKIVDRLLAQGVADADVEQKAADVITAATAAVKQRAKSVTPPVSLQDKWTRLDGVKSRVQIIYGMIAMNQEFLDPANADFFSFILERRYRAIWRMDFFVNPNQRRGVFGYPDDTQKMKLNKESIPPADGGSALWAGYLDYSLPFTLTAAGKSDPVSTDDKLFTKNESEADRNLLACDPVATAIHLDALRAAKNPGALLTALAGLGDHYLKIDNPLGHCANALIGQRLVAVTSAAATSGDHADIGVGRTGSILEIVQDQLTPDILHDDNYIALNRPDLKFMIVLEDKQEMFTVESVNPATRMVRAAHLAGNYLAGAKIYVTDMQFPFYSTLPYHFVTDSRTGQALFEQLTVKSADLQVGDHIYVTNHPLYKIYYPTGAWGGEHSFVTEIDSRDVSGNAFRNSLGVAGHGLEDGPLLAMSDEMLAFVNQVLGILQALTQIHLANLKANGRATGKVATPAGTFNVTFTTRAEPSPGGTQVSMNVFEYSGKYSYSFLDKGKKLAFANPGFVIKELASNPDAAFQVFSASDTNSAVDLTKKAPPFLKAEFIGSGPADQFTLSQWAVTWFNRQTARIEFLPLFEKDNKTPAQLTFDDLLISKAFYATDDNGDFFVTRPRVDFSSGYQTFLTTNGAI